jgi:hypothetical protein
VDAEDEVVQIYREPRHQDDPRARIQAGQPAAALALVEAIQHQPAGTRLRAAREAILAAKSGVGEPVSGRRNRDGRRHHVTWTLPRIAVARLRWPYSCLKRCSMLITNEREQRL